MINFSDVVKYLKKNNQKGENGYFLNYLLEEGCVSKEWYEAILKEVLRYKPKRVIDVGCCLGIFGYLFANENIEYIGIDDNLGYNRFESDKIKFICADYYDVKEQFKNDIIISCLCVGYLIPVNNVVGKLLIVDSNTGTNKKFKCTAKVIELEGR